LGFRLIFFLQSIMDYAKGTFVLSLLTFSVTILCLLARFFPKSKIGKILHPVPFQEDSPELNALKDTASAVKSAAQALKDIRERTLGNQPQLLDIQDVEVVTTVRPRPRRTTANYT
jgi:hypothetical protein